MNWLENLKGKVKKRLLLKQHTTFNIGGPARFYIEPKDSDDLKLLLISAKRDNIPIWVIGAGSNILVNDKGLNGVVVRLNSAAFKKISFRCGLLEVDAGVSLSRLIEFTKKTNLSGAEFLVGIPGTVGGAIIMNAGICERKNGNILLIRGIWDLVSAVKVMDYDGKIKTLEKKDVKFGYRYSNLSKYIVLGASLKLKRDKKRNIKNRIKHYVLCRRLKQDYTHPSAGCVFKNPDGHSAARLIDSCGFKGKRINGAAVSEKHANFILNLGQAKATDVLLLMRLIQRKIKQKFNITLEPEIKIWQKKTGTRKKSQF